MTTRTREIERNAQEIGAKIASENQWGNVTEKQVAEIAALGAQTALDGRSTRMTDLTPEAVSAWLRERQKNCERHAKTVMQQDRAGWLEDAAYFGAAISLLAALERPENNYAAIVIDDLRFVREVLFEQAAMTQVERIDAAAALLRRYARQGVAEGAGESTRPTHRHYKGGFYRETKRGRATGDKPIVDLTPVVVYENEAGEVWVRAVEEFDGSVALAGGNHRRYRPLDPSETPSPRQPDTARAARIAEMYADAWRAEDTEIGKAHFAAGRLIAQQIAELPTETTEREADYVVRKAIETIRSTRTVEASRADTLARVQAIAEAERGAMTAKPCEPDIFKNGQAVCVVLGPSDDIEAWVKSIADKSKAAVDWHYMGGRGVVKHLGNDVERENVREVIRQTPPTKPVEWGCFL